MAGNVDKKSPEFREAYSRMNELRRLLEAFPGVFHDRLRQPSAFSADRMALDLRKGAVLLGGLLRLGVYDPQAYGPRIYVAQMTREIQSPLAVVDLIDWISTGLSAQAAKLAVPGLEVEWQIVRHAMRRAAAAVLDEFAAENAMASMRLNAEAGLIGVSRSARLVSGASDAILAREAERADAADPGAALASALEAAKEVRARIRRARRRIKEAKRAPRPPRTRRKRAAPPSLKKS